MAEAADIAAFCVVTGVHYKNYEDLTLFEREAFFEQGMQILKAKGG